MFIKTVIDYVRGSKTEHAGVARSNRYDSTRQTEKKKKKKKKIMKSKTI